jgi:Glycosyltransferases involved in cell wall biogenesis
MLKLSTIIITLNEERNIRRCLESVKAVSDEIIVMDSLSTDGTESICKEFGVRFVSQKWLGYSEQKNAANLLAKNDWILSIDADEQLSQELMHSISELDNVPDNSVFSFNRLTNYCGSWIHHCGWYPDAKIRIFNRNKAEWQGAVHESLKYVDHVEIQKLNGDLFHYSYYTLSEHLRQADKFTDITAQEAFLRKKKSSKFKILCNPCWKFFKDFVLKGGFLDGHAGYVVCKVSAFATFLKYQKLYDLQKRV